MHSGHRWDRLGRALGTLLGDAQHSSGNELGLLLREALRMHWEILGRELRHWD
jgi:hypothetical protein